ncbi:ephrin type-B receptor 3 [Capsaspora owczarzaki ATCC 30864]|uniref:ephrin type-B receptor 3 n=1 Tax=Capsaspora owczarzaki (strain ATCC 30864) TaxID=595528 RepID=UPI0001FE2E3D|nr:ephrin type-B receptor 3 [Capsaspora owczarzaki ATCC 30864]|eukprot:XP_004349373.1 ephrin type-B receptor 3 [Capsaspora owczarzaki ATCC 30864]
MFPSITIDPSWEVLSRSLIIEAVTAQPFAFQSGSSKCLKLSAGSGPIAIQLINVAFSGFTSTGPGCSGAISVSAQYNLTLTRCRFTSNGGNGPAVAVDSATYLGVFDSVFGGNANSAIRVIDTPLEIANSNFTNNFQALQVVSPGTTGPAFSAIIRNSAFQSNYGLSTPTNNTCSPTACSSILIQAPTNVSITSSKFDGNPAGNIAYSTTSPLVFQESDNLCNEVSPSPCVTCNMSASVGTCAGFQASAASASVATSLAERASQATVASQASASSVFATSAASAASAVSQAAASAQAASQASAAASASRLAASQASASQEYASSVAQASESQASASQAQAVSISSAAVMSAALVSQSVASVESASVVSLESVSSALVASIESASGASVAASVASASVASVSAASVAALAGQQSNTGAASSVPAIAGGVGGGCFLVVLVVAILLVRRRRQLKSSKGRASIAPGPANEHASFVMEIPTVSKGSNSDYNHYDNAGKGKKTASPESHYVDLERRGDSTYVTFYEEFTPVVDSLRTSISMESQLGQGEFGQVFKATVPIGQLPASAREVYSGLSIVPMAIKLLKTDADEKSRRDFVSEAQLVSSFKHPNIVRVLAVLLEAEPNMILLEFMPYGDLRTLLHRSVSTGIEWSQLEYTTVLFQIASGMAYLSSIRYVHRDLAARNCLVGDGLCVKIADFGLSRALAEEKDYYKVQTKGKLPAKWMAPESLHFRFFSSASDVWSFGIVCYEVYTCGISPYGDRKIVDILADLEKGERLPQPANCPEDAYSLMQKCWTWEATARPSFADCVLTLQGMRTSGTDGKVRDLGQLVAEAKARQSMSGRRPTVSAVASE